PRPDRRARRSDFFSARRQIAPIDSHPQIFPLPLPLPRRPLRVVHSAPARVPATSRCTMSTRPPTDACLLPPLNRVAGRRREVWRVGAQPDNPGTPRTYDAPNNAPLGALPVPAAAGRRTRLSPIPSVYRRQSLPTS